MPLPDERPRQSVANLIGRFEQQNKRTSVVLPRSPSVLSQHTGESTKTEGDVPRKEWPPVQFAPSINHSRPTPTASPPKAEPEPVQTKLDEPAQPPASPSPQKQSTAPPSSFKNSAQTKVVASSRPSLPLKPQSTGSSTPRKSAVTKSTPSTPAKSTPARPAAPSRAKTPTSARPKTPSAGLFAPTAASLAKARNAQPPAPTPVRKATLSSAVADRLSKPTAASLSKARTSPAAPTRGKTAPAARGGAARGGKPKALTKKPGKSDTAAAAVAPEPELEPEPEPAADTQEHINGHGFEPSQSTEAEGEHTEQQEEEDYHHEDVNVLASEEVEEQEEQHHNGHDVHHQETVHDKKVDNDIEDIVNFLEAPPRIRPSSAASIPDEVNDIPDEE